MVSVILDNLAEGLTFEEIVQDDPPITLADDEAWWWPDAQNEEYWPPGVSREETLEAFQQAFGTLGYEICQNDVFEEGFQKIAIYATFIFLLLPPFFLIHIRRKIYKD